MRILKRLFPSFASKATRGGKSRSEASAPQPSAEDTNFRLLAENSGDIICRINADNMPVYVSPSMYQVLGWTPEEFMAAGTRFIHPHDEPLVQSVHDSLIAGEIEQATVRCRMLPRTGDPILVEASARRARDANGAPGDVVIVMRDISERQRLEDELRAQALTDGLTGLGNRRAFDQTLDREWLRTLREGGQMSLLMLDVDHFKRFNDLYGHQAGDECLRVLASAIQQVVQRPGDVAARYGGEEIAIILPATGAEGALALAETVRASIESVGLHHAGNEPGPGVVTASIGVATAFARSGATTQMPAGLVLAADGALYRAKQSGRNKVVGTVLLTAPAE